MKPIKPKTMENKQTAVQWLFEQVNNLDWRNLQGDKKLEIYEQAKAMEKQQIIDAYVDGSYDMALKEYKPEQYYNETYTND